MECRPVQGINANCECVFLKSRNMATLKRSCLFCVVSFNCQQIVTGGDVCFWLTAELLPRPLNMKSMIQWFSRNLHRRKAILHIPPLKQPGWVRCLVVSTITHQIFPAVSGGMHDRLSLGMITCATPRQHDTGAGISVKLRQGVRPRIFFREQGFAGFSRGVVYHNWASFVGLMLVFVSLDLHGGLFVPRGGQMSWHGACSFYYMVTHVSERSKYGPWSA